MTDQLDFDHVYLSRNPRDTSVLAAAATLPRSGTARRRVYDYVHAVRSTDEEQQDALGMSPNTQRPRRLELVEMGLIRDTGERRRTRSGQLAIVWGPVE